MRFKQFLKRALRYLTILKLCKIPCLSMFLVSIKPHFLKRRKFFGRTNYLFGWLCSGCICLFFHTNWHRWCCYYNCWCIYSFTSYIPFFWFRFSLIIFLYFLSRRGYFIIFWTNFGAIWNLSFRCFFFFSLFFRGNFILWMFFWFICLSSLGYFLIRILSHLRNIRYDCLLLRLCFWV